MKWKRYQTKPTKVKTCQGLIILSWTAWLSNVFQDSKISIHGVIQRNLSILLLYCLEGPSELLLSWIIFYFCQKLIMLNVSWKRLTLLSMFWVRCTMTWIRQSIQSNFNWFNLYLLSPILHLNVLWNFTKHPPPPCHLMENFKFEHYMNIIHQNYLSGGSNISFCVLGSHLQ